MANRMVYFCVYCNLKLEEHSTGEWFTCKSCQYTFDKGYADKYLVKGVEYYSPVNVEAFDSNFTASVGVDKKLPASVNFEDIDKSIDGYLESEEFWGIKTPDNIKKELPRELL